MSFLTPQKIGKIEIDEVSLSSPPDRIFDRIHKEPFSFFLDSGIDKDKLGRYSFMGHSPFLVLKSKGNAVEIKKGGRIYHETGNPFLVLNEIINNYKISARSAFPFLGGGVGYFAYDLCHFIEKLPQRTIDDLKLPDCYFCFYDTILGYDHQKKIWYLAKTDFGEKDGCPANNSIIELIDREKNLVSAGIGEIDPPPLENIEPAATPESNFSKENYLRAIRKAKKYILAGDIYQVNLSQRFHTRLRAEPYQLYKKLRKINPAPFACYLKFPELFVVSSSPERFLQLKGKKVQTRPIKGTRPRGKNREEDLRLKKELINSEKDRAELNMIVDLERNDLGRVCDYGTVKVSEHASLERYATVYHLVSTVEGRLLPKYNCIDLIKACFPGGSITGAPKIRSMEIIDELEPTARSIYTGSIGYLGFNGDIDLNIAIRTIIVRGNNAYFQVGGGIVADSRPEDEYRETIDKARALIESLGSV